jgi:hypothetical protein
MSRGLPLRAIVSILSYAPNSLLSGVGNSKRLYLGRPAIGIGSAAPNLNNAVNQQASDDNKYDGGHGLHKLGQAEDFLCRVDAAAKPPSNREDDPAEWAVLGKVAQSLSSVGEREGLGDDGLDRPGLNQSGDGPPGFRERSGRLGKQQEA